MKKTFAIAAVSALLVSSSAYGQDSKGMLEEASQGVSAIEEVISNGQSKLEEARAEQDVPRVDCINSLLVNARGFLSVAQSGEANLRDAVNRNDIEAQNHHAKLVQLAVSKSRNIEAKMSECSREMVAVSGTTTLETKRECKVEPCLGGEEYYDPDLSRTLGTIHAKAEPAIEVDDMVSPDASPYQ
ncbi:MAG: hypothetical protein II767_07730 [Proteobacteria bacterium]|nr:hypothetical protein [Pseudomonadota bacterium]MBQ4360130.1 hypothetical protein [Pseudomonadota bacterium]